MLEVLHIIIVAAIPVIELRGAIPLAIALYNFPLWLAFTLAIIGNIIPPLFLIPFIGKINEYLSLRSHTWRKIFDHFLKKTRDNHQKKFEILKEFALVLLVAIPLPLTGAWTASLAAFVFGIPLKKAIPLILTGLVIAGIIVVFVTLGALAIFQP